MGFVFGLLLFVVVIIMMFVLFSNCICCVRVVLCGLVSDRLMMFILVVFR